MKNNDFKNQATAFIKSITKQRLYLAKIGKSKNPTAAEDARFIELHLRAYPSRTDNQMASFWIKNYERIENIIPGVKSGSESKRMIEFQELHQEANRLYNCHLFTSKPKQHGYSHA